MSRRQQTKRSGPDKSKQDASTKKPPQPVDANQLLDLQQLAGNQTVSQLVAQNKVNQPGDRFEQEAEQIAKTTPQHSQKAAEQTGEERPQTAVSPRLPGLAGGRPLTPEEKQTAESQLGANFDQVRLHTGQQADEMTQQLNARAFTHGQDIVMANEHYSPGTQAGQQLLTHELTHVVQQQAVPTQTNATPVSQTGAGGMVQRGLLGDIWEGVKSVGRSIGEGVSSAVDWLGDRARDVGNFLSGAAKWVGERFRDAGMWLVNLIRDLPERLARLATTLWEGLEGVVTFLPEAIQALADGGLKGLANWLWEKAKSGGRWVLTFVSRVFDVLGGPELLEFVWHLLAKTRPLSGEEIAAASAVMGPDAIRWGDVRVAEGGVNHLVFALQDLIGGEGKRPFVTFHTIHLPHKVKTKKVVHELVHVYQFETVGSLYGLEAWLSQAKEGLGAYNYGGPSGLVRDYHGGKKFSDFNRETQGQIAEDYYDFVIDQGGKALTKDQRKAYEYFINQLRAGQL